jgi:hypothetical protein
MDRSVVASSSLRLGRVVLHTQRRGRRWAGRPVGALPVGLSRDSGTNCPMDSVRATVAYVALRAQFGLLSRTASKPSKAQAPPLAWQRPMRLVMRVYARACSACGLAHVCLFLSRARGQCALVRLCVLWPRMRAPFVADSSAARLKSSKSRCVSTRLRGRSAGWCAGACVSGA